MLSLLELHAVWSNIPPTCQSLYYLFFCSGFHFRAQKRQPEIRHHPVQKPLRLINGIEADRCFWSLLSLRNWYVNELVADHEFRMQSECLCVPRGRIPLIKRRQNLHIANDFQLQWTSGYFDFVFDFFLLTIHAFSKLTELQALSLATAGHRLSTQTPTATNMVNKRFSK